MTAHGCFLCLSGYSSAQLKHILTEQGQGGVSGVDVSCYAGALRMFDISCCGIHLSCRVVLENVFTQSCDIMERLSQFECYVTILKLFRIVKSFLSTRFICSVFASIVCYLDTSVQSVFTVTVIFYIDPISLSS